MSKQKWLAFALVLGLLGGGAAVLLHLKAAQKLGKPGVKVTTVFGGTGLRIELPEAVLDYESKRIEPYAEEVAALPKDTTFARCEYEVRGQSRIALAVVMMGTDRTSIHLPEYCMVAQGWTVERSDLIEIPVAGATAYNLPVMRMTMSKQFSLKDGRTVTRKGLYTYWFVADGRVTAKHSERTRWMAKDLLLTGVLQRWAYVSCFTDCAPGEEAMAFLRVQQFIAAAVPQFQIATPLGQAADKTVAAATAPRAP